MSRTKYGAAQWSPPDVAETSSASAAAAGASRAPSTSLESPQLDGDARDASSDKLQGILSDHALVGSLLSEYRFLPHQFLPFIGNGVVAQAVTDARPVDIASLSVKDAALAYAVLAGVARSTSHQTIAGDDAAAVVSHFSQARRTGATLDLRRFGKARDALCVELEERAKAYALSAGVGLDLRPESALIALLINTSRSPRDPASKIWSDSLVYTIRALREREVAVAQGKLVEHSTRTLSIVCANLALTHTMQSMLSETPTRV